MRLVGNYYLIKLVDQVTRSGLILTARTDNKDRGIVAMAGDGIMPDGSVTTMYAKVGDTVILVDPKAVMEVTVETDKMYVISNANILAVIEA